MNSAPDLTKQAPRSARVRIHNYVILARTLDKCRASLAGNLGDYHFDCPLDNILFGFKGIDANAFRERVRQGGSDDDIAQWVTENGTPKTEQEIIEWSASVEANNPSRNPEKRDWFVGECASVGIDPETSTLFDYLEADDRKSFPG